MHINTKFTSLLCLQQILMCYINSFMFKSVCSLYGSKHIIMTISNIAEIINNILRAISTTYFKYKSDKFIFIINNLSGFLLLINTFIFAYSLYDNYNLKLCAISWIINRIATGINAACRDSMLYRFNKLYNIDVNVPIVKTIKSVGNILNLAILFLIIKPIYNWSVISIHYFLCVIGGLINCLLCIMLYTASKNIIGKIIIQEDIIDKSNKITLIKNLLFLTLVTFCINMAQIDDAIVFFKIQNPNYAFFYKQCVGQVLVGGLYSLLFKNSPLIIVIGPIVNLLFHIISLLDYNIIGAIVIGTQFMTKNATYLLLSMFFYKYNLIYPSICIIADAICMIISNLVFIKLSMKYGDVFAHKVFIILGAISTIFGIYFINLLNYKNKDIKNNKKLSNKI